MDGKAERVVPGSSESAHIDRFVHDNLPPQDLWPSFDFSNLPDGITYPDRMNCAKIMLDDNIERGFGDRPAVLFDDLSWSYSELNALVNQIANVLVQDFNLVPGNRVLLRGPNTPILLACWLATVKAGGVCVTTMALLRAAELVPIIEKIKPRIALCDVSAADALKEAVAKTGIIEHLGLFTDIGAGIHPTENLDLALSEKSDQFDAVDTAANDPAIAAFTSGTTGVPKCAIHFHRGLMAASDCFPRDVWDVQNTHVFSGSPPIAFTYGLGASILIPMRFGACVALVATPTPENLLGVIEQNHVTDLYTAPTMYRRMVKEVGNYDISSLARCNSAGEHLPMDTFDKWEKASGLKIIDQLGSTEMFHNFLSTPPADLKAGTTGRPVKGFVAKLINDNGDDVPTGEIGQLAVRGPNGCLYLGNEERQRAYVRDGWNITGDLMRQDAAGFYSYAGRADDLIVSSGYNISGIEIEQALLQHEMVAECAVIGVPDPDRGAIVKAVIVTTHSVNDEEALSKELQSFVKASIAPYKYPRLITFLEALPRTPTGKIQRFKLIEMHNAANPATSTQTAPASPEIKPMKKILQITVNGRSKTAAVGDNVLLIDYLREDVGLTGTKMGCDGGECGACTILVDGEPRLSCITLAQSCAGADIETVEGLVENGRPGPVQRAFHEKLGSQCGYCTPGMIMASEALLRENPNPTDEEIRTALGGNICRCTGYVKIIESVQDAAAMRKA